VGYLTGVSFQKDFLLLAAAEAPFDFCHPWTQHSGWLSFGILPIRLFTPNGCSNSAGRSYEIILKILLLQEIFLQFFWELNFLQCR